MYFSKLTSCLLINLIVSWNGLLSFAKVMERNLILCYNGEHETPWHPNRAGKAAPTRHPIIEKGKNKPFGHCPVARGIQKLRLPMVSGLSGERIQGAEIQDGSRASAKVATRAKRETKPALAGRSINLRISDRPVDFAAGCADNSEELWGPIPPQPCLEIAFGNGVELPETGTPGFGEKGRGDRPLEAVSLAAYKKTRKNLAPTCFFSMRAGFCSFLRSPARGLPGGKPPGCIIATRGTRFRRSVLWSCLRKGEGWLFLSSSGNGI